MSKQEEKELNTYLREFYTIKQLSQDLGLTIPVLRKYINEDKLTASKLGNKYVLTRDNIIKFLKENEDKTFSLKNKDNNILIK